MTTMHEILTHYYNFEDTTHLILFDQFPINQCPIRASVLQQNFTIITSDELTMSVGHQLRISYAQAAV